VKVDDFCCILILEQFFYILTIIIDLFLGGVRLTVCQR